MSDRENWRERCHCGHDKVTHHEGKYNCLGLYCNECKTYRNEWGPVKPPTESVVPPAPETEPDLDDEDDDDVHVKMPWGYP
jgi:hypothetical protein